MVELGSFGFTRGMSGVLTVGQLPGCGLPLTDWQLIEDRLLQEGLAWRSSGVGSLLVRVLPNLGEVPFVASQAVGLCKVLSVLRSVLEGVRLGVSLHSACEDVALTAVLQGYADWLECLAWQETVVTPFGVALPTRLPLVARHWQLSSQLLYGQLLVNAQYWPLFSLEQWLQTSPHKAGVLGLVLTENQLRGLVDRQHVELLRGVRAVYLEGVALSGLPQVEALLMQVMATLRENSLDDEPVVGVIRLDSQVLRPMKAQEQWQLDWPKTSNTVDPREVEAFRSRWLVEQVVSLSEAGDVAAQAGCPFAMGLLKS
jgi:hypothetical protein